MGSDSVSNRAKNKKEMKSKGDNDHKKPQEHVGNSSGNSSRENGGESKLDWMYKSSTDLINRDEYLLGRRIDKSFDLLEAEEQRQDQSKVGIKKPLNHVEHECIPFSIRSFRTLECTEQVDLQRKVLEDPLMIIKEREMEKRCRILENPVKLRALQKRLKTQVAPAKLESKVINKKSKKSKKSKKAKKNTNGSDSDICSDSDLYMAGGDINKLIEKRFSKQKNNLLSKADNVKELNLKTLLDSKYKNLEQLLRTETKKKSKKGRDRSNSSRSNDSNDQNNRTHDGKRHKNQTEGKQRESTERLARDRRRESYARNWKASKPRRSFSPAASSTSRKYNAERYAERSRSPQNRRSPTGRYNSNARSPRQTYDRHDRRDQNRHRSRSRSPANRKRICRSRSSLRPLENEKNRKHNRSQSRSRSRSKAQKIRYISRSPHNRRKSLSPLQKRLQKDPEHIRNSSPDKMKRSNINTTKTNKLTVEEKEARRREMMKNAEWREEDRTKAVQKHRESYSREEEQLVARDFDKEFINKQVQKAIAKQTSVSSRIRSNLNNIQRTSAAMNSNFARK